MTASTLIPPPPVYVCLLSDIHATIDKETLFAEIARLLGWDADKLVAARIHAQNHVHTKLFLAPKDLAETRASVLVPALQRWVAHSSHLPPSTITFRIGVCKNE